MYAKIDCRMDRISHLDCIAPILIEAGSWLQHPDQKNNVEVKHPTWSCLDVCRRWRDCMLDQPTCMADLLRVVHGPEEALVRAASCAASKRVDRLALLKAALKTARADCKNGLALVKVAANGDETMVRLLLEWKEHAPRANCRDDEALVRAAGGGHEAVVRLLLEWKEHAPRADCWVGEALVRAAGGGHEAVFRLLLDWREHAPRADCQDGDALVRAAVEGHEAIVRLLLNWREHAPRADCQFGDALVLVAEKGHGNVVQLLLDWKEHAPRAYCQDGMALVWAAMHGHEATVHLLLKHFELPQLLTAEVTDVALRTLAKNVVSTAEAIGPIHSWADHGLRINLAVKSVLRKYSKWIAASPF